MPRTKSSTTWLRTGWLLLVLLGGSIASAQTVFVWPGDVNDNGRVNHVDLLYLGLHYGLQGTGRDSVSIDWVVHEVDKWLPPVPGRIDPAHADCNGDSTVNALDVAAIRQNYGLDNGFVTADSSSLAQGLGFPPLELALPGGGLQAGQADTLDLILGSTAQPLDSLLGFAATLSFDSSLVDTLYVIWEGSWLGGPSQLLDFQRKEGGALELAVTRTDRNQVIAGAGRIGGVVVVMEDNLKRQASAADLQLEFRQALALSGDGRVQRVSASTATFPVAGPLPVGKAWVYPNPVRSQLHIAATSDWEGAAVSLIDLSGRKVANWGTLDGLWSRDMAAFRPGLYLVELRKGEAILRQKIILIKE